ACVLLEHLLDTDDFDRFFERVRMEIANGRVRFLDTLGNCVFDGRNGPNYERVQAFLRSARRDRPTETP
ncbi:MAG TPA: hypothetical protein VF247_12195, partial [Candidatus Krumholzibacteria bacterium]